MDLEVRKRIPAETASETFPLAAAQALEQALKKVIRGEVRFDAGTRAMYATDASNYRQVPIGVVIPRDAEDVVAAMALCRRFDAPILARGGGTSLAGQCCNVAVTLDFSKYMHQVLEVDAPQRLARVQPGTILDTLRDAAAPHELTFGPDPATHNHCTLGGMIGNNSCGMHAQFAGKTCENILALDVLLYDGTRMTVKNAYSEEEIDEIVRAGGRQGEIFAQLRALRDRHADEIRARTPKIPRAVSGYALHYLLPEEGFNVAGALVGSECTCVMILEATTKLVYSYPARVLAVLGYPDVYQAGDHVKEIVEFGPIALEGMDDLLIQAMVKKNDYPRATQLLPQGNGWLMVEFGGASKEEATARARAMLDALAARPDAPHMKLFEDEEEQHLVWKAREGGLGATAFVPGEPDTWEGWEDSACPPERVGDYLRDLKALFAKYDYHPALYGHFGQGCIHCRVAFDLYTEAGIRHWRAFLTEAAELVARYGGSLSGEHGDGQSRAELLPIMFGETMVQAFREFKAIWDPDGKMNPGKKVDAYPITANLRLGTDYAPPVLDTHFKFPDDHGSFAHAALRCVGVGECRRLEGGTMCPSFMVTREEQHATRGRAHALFEMLNGSVITQGWQDEAVKEALDLCFSCKGCKADCPVNVDMATYKAEFLSHYYEGKRRPNSAYAMGLIYWWARLAERMPGTVNALAKAPGLSRLAKRAAGIALQRRIPAFAHQTFKAWWRARAPRNAGQKRVLLWPDTFNNHFRPDIAIATVEVLEAAGYQVIVPEASLCCGRPLYDYGFLDKAEALLKGILANLRPYIESGVPVVGLEPSCVAVFRDELCNLFPTDENARRLKAQTFILSEFVENEQIALPELKQKALVQAHCHHRAVMKLDSEEQVLKRLGLDYEVLDSGCCGMAGSFGFEAEHYEVSLAAGERVLLPAVRAAEPETLILTNGFSCREQIEQTTDRTPLHLAEVLHQAFKEAGRLGGTGPAAPARKRRALGWLFGRQHQG